MINNFEQIRNLLSFPDENAFYFVEVIKRRKENPEMSRHAETIKDFYVKGLQNFDSQFLKMKDYCDRFNARAYFRLNRRDARMLGLQCNKRLAEILITEDWKALKSMYASVVGEFHSDPDKKWLLDIDGVEVTKVDEIVTLIEKLRFDAKQSADAIVANISTKNGLHLITRPFRMDVFRKHYTEAEVPVHKDNPTVLYMP